ncbi:MAG: phosphoenolpyruvate carboxykinase (ATP) [Caldisericaceae bacterium]|nr:phosphoenolpyruvate carboxykinase (ATP) [Caldisericaceae bacterium]
MYEALYNEPFYEQFYQELKQLLQGPNIKTVNMHYLEKEAKKYANKSNFGSYVWMSKFSSRLAPKTVYLGSPRVRLPKPLPSHVKILENHQEELKKVLHLVKNLPFVHIRRQMGHNDYYNPICNLYVSVADPKNVRNAYMWASTMFDVGNRPGPELIMLHIPEEHMMRAQVLALPEYNLNIALGTDYLGENKKGFLRQAMWRADEQGMLGLHAGTKIVTVRDPNDNRLKKYGVFLFGMTATGKSTWSCHQLGLDHTRDEKTEVCQDDIVFLRDDGSALGSENNFYVKTDVRPEQQEAMYNALIHKSALLENIMMNYKGEIDFLDESLCGNGRAVIFRKRLAVRQDKKLVGISAPTVNLPPLDEMDGIIFAFITRRNTIMPFAQRLTPEQGVLAYLWGESTHSYASNPEKAGESVRIVGTDPFIIGSRGVKVNRFYDIVMKLVEKYPDKVRFMMYNTGGMGEIIETSQQNGKLVKKLVRKVERVPLNLMAAIQRGDLRGTNTYEKGILGTEGIVAVEGRPLHEYDVRRFYSEEQINQYFKELIEGRKKFTEEIASEGLKPEIVRAAERAFMIEQKIAPTKVSVPDAFKEKVAVREEISTGVSSMRPRRPGIWRWR